MPKLLLPVLSRPFRLLFAMLVVLGVLGVNPVFQPALAAPAGVPPAQPARAPNSDLLPSPVPTVLVTTATIANNAADGQCDLWEAMQAVFQANFNLSPTYHECTAIANVPNVIGFNPAVLGSTIQVPSTVNSGDLPFAWGDTTILGPITIKPSATNTDTHLLRFAADANISLIAVTLSDAHTSGGGAAILDTNHATVNLIGSNIQGNVADNDGGAINSDGNVNVTLSNFSGNQSLGIQPGTGYGGAINLTGSGSLVVAKSNFAGNTARAGGGAIYSTTGNGDIEDSLFSGNIGGQDINRHGGGGAIYNDVNALMAIARTQFAGNLSPQGSGGAIWNNAGATLAITDTTFAANLAGDLSHATLGGAIYDQEDLHIYRSSFVNNISVKGDGGALAVDSAATAAVANSTFAANTAPFGFGGAVVITQTQPGGPASTFIARNDTIATNAAPSGHGGGIFNGAGQNLDLGNTILASNLIENCAGDGNLTFAGHNLDSGTSCNLPNSNGNISNGSADLGGPSFNGGPLSSMLTMKPNYGSDAIDAGDDTICAGPLVGSLDQRSSKRPTDGTNPGNINPICDIGAYEADGPSPSYASDPSEPGPIDVGSTMSGTTVATTLVVSNTGNFLLTITPHVLTGSNPGDFSVPQAVINIPAGGAPVSIPIQCTPHGLGSRSAALAMATDDVPLHAAVGYLLKCNGTAVPVAGFSSSPIPPGPISFGSTIVGHTSTRTINVFETGDAALNVTHNPITGANPSDFSVSGDTFSIVDGGASHNITIHCTPSDVGLRTATLTLTTNDNTQTSVSYALSCQGVPVPAPYLAAGSSLSNSPDRGLNDVYGVSVSSDGKDVYAASRADGTVSSFSRDPASGALTFLGKNSDPGFSDGSYLMALSPDDHSAYVAGRTNHALVQWTRNAVTGQLMSPVHYQRSDLGGAFGVAVSPDGRNVYATGTYSNSVVVFLRNTTTGQITATQAIVSGLNLSGAAGITVSPDGQNVYVADYTNDPVNNGKLAVYKRNALDGHLTLVQLRFQGDCIDYLFCGSGLDGLKGAYQVRVSPDGLNVYLVSYYSNALLAFSRDQVDGSLHILDSYFNGVLGVSGIGGATGVDMTPDGLHVLVAGYVDKAVSVFGRDPATGILTFLQEFQRSPLSGGNPALPLDGALDTHATADGLSVYTSGNIDSALVVLQVANPTPTLDSIIPASAVKDTANVILTVNGDDFVPGAQVKLDGLPLLPTTFVGSHQLQLNISDYVHVVGQQTVRVFNPVPGGGFSNSLNFTTSGASDNPNPAIDHITPQGGLAGGITTTLDVYGAGFIQTSTIDWNGNVRPTTYVGGGHLQTTLPRSLVSQPGTSSVTVFNGGPGGGISNAVPFNVAQPGQNAAPSLTSLNPLSVYSFGAASKQIQITVTGQNFIAGSTVRLNGASRPTLFVDSSHLKATIFGSDLTSPALVSITVFTPAPGGGTSSALTFRIKKWFPLYVPFSR